MNEPREHRYSTGILTRDHGDYTEFFCRPYADHRHYLGAVGCWHGYHRHGWTAEDRDGHQLCRFRDRDEAIDEVLYTAGALR
ncbi:MAG: hypothetical protein ACRDMV_21200 [Streptosporangiales bacterium]